MNRIKQLQKLTFNKYAFRLTDKQANIWIENDPSATPSQIAANWFNNVDDEIFKTMEELNRHPYDDRFTSKVRRNIYFKIKNKLLRKPEQLHRIAKAVLHNIVQRELGDYDDQSDSDKELDDVEDEDKEQSETEVDASDTESDDYSTETRRPKTSYKPSPGVKRYNLRATKTRLQRTKT